MKKIIAMLLALVMVLSMTACGSQPAEAEAKEPVLTTIREVKGDFIVTGKTYRTDKFGEDRHFYIKAEAYDVEDMLPSGCYATDVQFAFEVSEFDYERIAKGDHIQGAFKGSKTPEHILETVTMNGHTYRVSKSFVGDGIKTKKMDGEFLIVNIENNNQELANGEEVVELYFTLQKSDFTVKVQIPNWDWDEFTDLKVGDVIDATYIAELVRADDSASFKWDQEVYSVHEWWTE